MKPSCDWSHPRICRFSYRANGRAQTGQKRRSRRSRRGGDAFDAESTQKADLFERRNVSHAPPPAYALGPTSSRNFVEAASFPRHHREHPCPPRRHARFATPSSRAKKS